MRDEEERGWRNREKVAGAGQPKIEIEIASLANFTFNCNTCGSASASLFSLFCSGLLLDLNKIAFDHYMMMGHGVVYCVA